jgi:hypothetical protein
VDNTHLWERQPNETLRAFGAFCIYRDLGADRSLSKVREKLGRRSGYDRQLQEWSSQYNWVYRVGKYDEHLDELSIADFEQSLLNRRRSILALEIAHADALLEKFGDMLQFVQIKLAKKDGEKEVEALNIGGLHELTKWRRDLAEFARLTVSMPGRIAQGQHTGKDGGPLRIEWSEPLNEDDEIGIGEDELPDAT